MSDLLNSSPPQADLADLPKNSIPEDVKKLQRKMEALFQKQKKKGGIIDLEAEKNKFLVVTNSDERSETRNETKFEELSPTDYQLGKVSFTKSRSNEFLIIDESGIPCANMTPVSSVEREPEQPEYVHHSYSASYCGRGRNGKKGFRKESSTER